MTQITFEIPDQHMPRVIAAFSEDYMPEIDGQPNPMTRPQYAKKQMWKQIMWRIRAYEASQISEIEMT